MDDADPGMSEVADRESLRARRPSSDLTSMRDCLHRLSSSTDGGVDAGSRAGAGAGAGMRRLRTSGDSSCMGGGRERPRTSGASGDAGGRRLTRGGGGTRVCAN